MGWIAIAAVALEAVGLAVGLVVWGWPALIIVGPVLLGTLIVTVVLWLTVVPQRMLRAHVEGRPQPGAGGSAWPSDGGLAAEPATHHGWHSPSDSGWSGGGAPSDSWSDSTSSGSSDGSSSSSSDSSSSGSSDSSSSSW